MGRGRNLQHRGQFPALLAAHPVAKTVQQRDENVHLVRSLLDEVFGSDNFVTEVVFKKTGGLVASRVPTVFDYILWYARDRDQLKYRPLYTAKDDLAEVRVQYDWVELADRTRRRATQAEMALASSQRGVRFLKLDNPTSAGNPEYAFQFCGRTFLAGFKTNPQGMMRLANSSRLLCTGNGVYYVRYVDDFGVSPLTNLWTDTSASFQRKSYVVQTVPKVIERCLLMTTDPGDLVLDPTCGSGTTAYVAEQWGRRWITIDTSRVALALARTRIMSAVYPYYILADSPEGVAKRAEIAGEALPARIPPTGGDIKQGFVYQRVPHIQLKDIANNEEIDVIYERWQERMEPLRARLNELVGASFEEWELPREPAESWPAEAAEALRSWWELRLQRQAEIDASIARHSEAEILYDRPYEDRKRVRVAGPFTVESLSPHRVLSTDQDLPATEAAAQDDAAGPGQFESMIIENLRKAGVQNTYKDERLVFDRLDPYAGRFIHAEGEQTRADGTVERIAVTIGPEHGTVGPELIKDAAKEAVQGIGFDTLIVCGFALDPHVSEEAKRYPNLTVLPVRMNPDLTLSDDLLKKTSAANLFMIFGEPDLEIRREDGQVVVEVRGLDIYDPTTGEIRNSSTDDIACWFIDTNYNEESFFVRHAYFTGGDEPYEQLARALRADVDEEAWQALYTTVSRPFDPPATGRIAVKIINHYGDEVLKVYDVGK